MEVFQDEHLRILAEPLAAETGKVVGKFTKRLDTVNQSTLCRNDANLRQRGDGPRPTADSDPDIQTVED